MSDSTTGGLGPARGSAHESKILAWFGAHMLAGQRLSDRWAPGGVTVSAIGGQTARPIDDIGAVTSVGGHLLAQAKAGLGLGTTEDSPLAKAIRQVVEQYCTGIPADPEDGKVLRQVEPERDRLLIVTDYSAPLSVREGLIVAADALSELADSLPFTDVGHNASVVDGRDALLGHLRREWEAVRGTQPSDADLRDVLRVLRIVAIDLRDDATDHGRALQLLGQVFGDSTAASTAWRVLVTRCHELAENKHWARRERLREKLAADGLTFRRRTTAPREFHLPRMTQPAPSKPTIGVGEGDAAWTRRYHDAFNALNGPIQLGEPTSLLEQFGPGVAQHYGAVWVAHGWVLTALPGHLPVAVVDSIWNAVQDSAATGVADLGFPTLDSAVPAASRIIGPEAHEVRLAAGARGAGRLVRASADVEWIWQPDVVPSMDGVRLARHWTPDPGQFDLRVRVAVTMPWNTPGQHISITPDGRARLGARLPDSPFGEIARELSAKRGGDLQAGPWQLSARPRSQSLYRAVYESAVGTTPSGSALLCEVGVTTPNQMQTYPVAFVDVQVDYGLWRDALGISSPDEVALVTVAELAGILDGAWLTAAELAPLAVTADPMQMSLTDTPKVEIHIQPCPTVSGASMTLNNLLDLSTFGSTTFGDIPEMCIALTASLTLSLAERHQWVRKALAHMAQAFGFIAATEDAI